MSQGLFPTHRVLWMPLHFEWRPPSRLVTHCCPTMTAALAFDCDEHAAPFDCADTVIVYHEPFDEYGIPIDDGGMGYLLIANCPWCGVRLPRSRRDDWFNVVEAGGWEDDAIPERYLTAEWRLDVELSPQDGPLQTGDSDAYMSGHDADLDPRPRPDR